MNARLTLFLSDGPVRELLLNSAERYRVGRSPDCEIQIDDVELSRQHARLQFEDDAWTIVDTESKNGLRVAGRTTQQSALGDLAWISLGTSVLRFETLDAEASQRLATRETQQRAMTVAGCRRIDAAPSVAAVLQGLLDSFMSISATERGFALLTQPDGDLEVACSRGIGDSDRPDAFVFSRGAVDRAIESAGRVVVCDVQSHAELAQRASVAASEARALVCLPLRATDATVGVVYADSRTPGRVFTELDVDMLEELADRAALAIAASRLDAELAEVDRVLRDSARTRARLPTPGRSNHWARALPMSGVYWSCVDLSDPGPPR